MSNQKILCVSRSLLEASLGGSIPLGFTGERNVFNTVAKCFRENGEFLERSDVENDPLVLQAIVYGIVNDGEKVLGFWRARRNAENGVYKETRHNNKIGLACGGHVEPKDNIEDPDFFGKAFLRELKEEIYFPDGHGKPDPLGVIMYEETLFDRVHMGLIYSVQARTVETGKEDDEYDKVEFLAVDQLSGLKERMEGWGKVIADAITEQKIIFNKIEI